MAKLKDILYEPFKKWAEKGTIWIYSDPHFGDSDCQLMDPDWPTPEEQVTNINRYVGKNDTLIILGDIGDIQYVKKLKGYKVLIAGNHDKGLSNYVRKQWTEDVFVIDENNKYVSKKEEIQNKPDFIYFPYRLHQVGYFDNRLFDEVYGGPLFISEKLLLSHEPIDYQYGLNIHGHDHARYKDTSGHINACSNTIDYKPIRLGQLIDDGILANIETIHRATIDNAIERKEKNEI